MPELAPLQQLLGFTVSPLELVLRGSVVYWGLFLLFRFVLRRDTGAIGIADILLLVLVADAAQNAMSGGYQSLSEGALLVVTIIGWNWLMDWAAFRFSAVRRFAEPDPLVLVRRGRMLEGNMRREYISTPELMANLREQGIDKLAQVKLARMEPDGRISVIRYPHAGDAEPGPPHGAHPGG
jgi:uncharacterized membrane protein YcaP (DUF421 family)